MVRFKIRICTIQEVGTSKCAKIINLSYYLQGGHRVRIRFLLNSRNIAVLSKSPKSKA